MKLVEGSKTGTDFSLQYYTKNKTVHTTKQDQICWLAQLVTDHHDVASIQLCKVGRELYQETTKLVWT